MLIVDRQSFLQMPSGTVFSKFTPCVFDDLQIKLDSCGNDFYAQDIAGAIENEGFDFAERLFAARDEGLSLKMDFDCCGRDGLFEKEQLFAVWDRQDVMQLIRKLAEGLGVASVAAELSSMVLDQNLRAGSQASTRRF